ncbi:uncharacterized protein TNCV_451051 [Trichonephila clavipes]|nr:uncharacterized protein TNCV_451051 [Trichonephila clavipes]
MECRHSYSKIYPPMGKNFKGDGNFVIKNRQGLGSNPAECTDFCKFIVPLRHGGPLNSRQAVIPLVRLMEGDEMWEASDHSQGVLPLNWGRTEPNNSTVTCMVLKATSNDRRTTSSLNFVGLALMLLPIRAFIVRLSNEVSKVFMRNKRGGLMVWASFSISGHTDMHIIRNGNLKAQKYVNEILRPHALPYVEPTHLLFLPFNEG